MQPLYNSELGPYTALLDIPHIASVHVNSLKGAHLYISRTVYCDPGNVPVIEAPLTLYMYVRTIY